MDLQAAERIAGVSDPNAIMALQKQSGDPAVGKAVAEQFGTLLMERALQNADGSALAMASGVGSNVVNSMFAGTIAQTAMSGDRLGLADLLFRSMTAKQSAAGGHAAAAAPAAAPHAMPATGTAAGPGLPLSPYWQDHGLRPLGDRSLQRPASAPAPMPAAPSRGGATPVAPSTAAPASASPTHTAPTAAAATPIAVTALPPIAPASASTKDPAA
ncbi:MAG TPA: hypothetical protein VME41_04665, partial [Stellaceae bacterium]|nr:hypothetical protein [Stellaceae bacterium]